MSRFEYPRLSRSEIVAFLSESQIVSNISEHQLADPSCDFVCDVYTQLLIHLDSFQEEDGMDFDAIGQLENPDFHIESTRKVNLYCRVKEVIASLACPNKFTLKDLVKPSSDRTEIFVSAILNFCIHKDNISNLLRPIMEELSLLYEQQNEWEAKISQLNDDIARHNEAREKERPLVQEVDSKLRELRQTISELNNHQMSLRTAYKKLKEKGAEMDEKISSAEFSLVQAVQENAILRSKIVQSPDKLQRALEEKKSLRDEAVNSEKIARQAFEYKNTVVEVYTKASKKMTKHLTQMQKIQEQVNSAKSIEKEVKLLKAKLSDGGLLDKQLDVKLVELQERVEQLEEQKKIVNKERQVKYEEATRELNNVKLKVESGKQELQARQKQVAAVVAEAEAMTLRTNKVNESNAAKQQLLKNKCEDVMKSFQQYSSSMRSVMPSVEPK